MFCKNVDDNIRVAAHKKSSGNFNISQLSLGYICF